MTSTIYKLVDTDTGDFYIGATKNSLEMRLKQHKQSINYRESKIYTRMKEVGLEKWDIFPLCIVYEDIDYKELYKLEGDFIRKLKPKYNTKVAGRSKFEKYDCDCGGRYDMNHRCFHIKTKKHLNYLSTLNNQ
jgi:hypothetical protein